MLKSYISPKMKVLQLLFSLLFSLALFSQELPPIEKFSPEIYEGENQNWMISQASNNFIYIANNGGLLEYDGAKWKMTLSPNNTIIRSLNVIDDKIYIGCFKEFGYYKKDSIGKLQYHSLVPKLDNKLIDDENIWNILPYQEWILFQSQRRIYFYNTLNDNFKIINSKNTITKTFNVDNTIYYHVTNEGLYKITQGKPKLLIPSEDLNEDRIINIFSTSNKLLFLTHKSGFYVLKENVLTPWKFSVNNIIKNMSIFTSIQLEDGSFVLGTIANGIVHLSKEGELIYHINQKNGLSNNTALSLFEDIDKNVWVGLDNGINCINIKSPVKVFNDDEGILGTVYTSTIFKNYLYLGTNQGLFYKVLNSSDAFQFIEGTAGQVWSLFVFNDNELFCGHHNGTFLIDQDQVTKICAVSGTWDIKSIPNKEKLLLQGNYSGLYILEKNKGIWKLKKKINGFDNSARHFEINNQHIVWVSHGYKGVFRLKLNKDLVNISKPYLETNLTIGQNSSLIKYKNELLFASRQGIFKYKKSLKKFVYDSIFSPILEKESYLSGKLVVDKNDRLWAFSKNNINYLTIDNLTNTPKVNQISIPSHLRKAMVGYENISRISEKEYLLGTTNGYITLDLSKIDYSKEYSILLNSVSLKNIENQKVEFSTITSAEFKYKSGVLTFNYSVPEYDKYLAVKYQYQLEGHFNQWTDWTEDTEVSFENLSFGDYRFNVRAKIGNKLSHNIATYSFKINRPWYLSNLAIVAYLLSIGLLTFIIHRAYKKYYNKQHQHKQLENEQLIMQIKNEKLNQEIENKNRELAISTMSIIKRNQFLNSIKKELKKNNQITDNDLVIKLIDKNLNSEKDWKFFEEAFNNADKHFLDKVKKVHPNLTPNDLRFCAYLRLNLSSKEIAPLLNISVRSVEIKRYRLRKKMNLLHDEGLVNHILEI